MNAYSLDQSQAPYLDQLHALDAAAPRRLHVPGHQGDLEAAEHLVELVGEVGVRLDFPALITEIDLASGRFDPADVVAPIEQARRLAADAWGAEEAWLLTQGATMVNHLIALALGTLTHTTICQRSVHSSVLDGMILSGLDPVFLQPSIDIELGTNHGVTAEQVAAALQERPDAGAVQIVSPSYFGAVADIAAIAEVCHAHDVALIVDEAWGSHFGFHPDIPGNAIRAGADLVVSSSHKGAGSLTQSAMLLRGAGPHARALGEAIRRALPLVQTTSPSGLLLGSLDAARRHLAVHGEELLGRTLADVTALRAALAEDDRFHSADAAALQHTDVVALDPLTVVLDLRFAGIGGHEAMTGLMADHGIIAELATPQALVFKVGLGTRLDVDGLMSALHALPRSAPEGDPIVAASRLRLPEPGARARGLREAWFSPAEIVPADEAEGRISADAIAVYPPGVPAVLPGEVITAEVIDHLAAIAALPGGHLRGSVDRDAASFRVLSS